MRIDATIDVNSHSLFFTHSLNVLYNRISTISISPITIPINNIVNIAFTILIPPSLYAVEQVSYLLSLLSQMSYNSLANYIPHQ